jgi:uncharacterized membrane protein
LEVNVVSKYPRIAAVVLSLLMLGNVAPIGDAQSTNPLLQTLPRLPTLGQAVPTDHCLQLGDVETTALAAENGLVAQGVAYFAYDRGVPAICAFNGQPIDQWQYLVQQANNVILEYRNVTNLLQTQLDARLGYTYPAGPCQSNDNLTRAPDNPGDPSSLGAGAGPQLDNGAHCGVTRPQFVPLDDSFNGRRVGGFGEWTAVTAHGETPGWHVESKPSFNGTDTSWRFGTDAGYARGDREFLVSPEIDLTPVRGDAQIVQDFQNAYLNARTALTLLCNPGQAGVAAIVGAVTGNFCGSGPNSLGSAGQGEGFQSTGNLIVAGYQKSLDAYTADLPLGHEAASLDVTFRMNFADEQDGLRPWLFVGNQPPTRLDLFNASIGTQRATDPGNTQCADAGVPGSPASSNPSLHNAGVTSYICTQTNGTWIYVPKDLTGDQLNPQYQPWMNDTLAFVDGVPPGDVYHRTALTGNFLQPQTMHVDLSSLVGKRVWLVLEVATTPDLGRGGDYFHDLTNFPRQDQFGFQLLRVRTQADAWPRMLRVKDVAQTFLPVPANDPWADDPTTTRTTNPPGTDPIEVRVQNAGEYDENATVNLTIQEQTWIGDTPIGGFHDFASVQNLHLLDVRPSEVRILGVPWPRPLAEGNLYNVSVVLSTPDQAAAVPDLSNVSNVTDPNVTAERPPNFANDTYNGQFGGHTSAYGVLRAFTDHHLTPAHLPVGTAGPILQVCSIVGSDGTCTPQYTGNRGQHRVLYVGIRNDGSAVEQVSAHLSLQLDGIEQPSALLDPDTVLLQDLQPGESRPVQWSIAPPEPGVYKAVITFVPLNATSGGASISRNVYVERSPGIICFDNIGDDRECAPSFQRDAPDVFLPSDLSGSDGRLGLQLDSMLADAQSGDRATALTDAQSAQQTYLFSMTYGVSLQDAALDAAVKANFTRLLADVPGAPLATVQADAAAVRTVVDQAAQRGSHGGLDLTADAQAPDGTLYVYALDMGSSFGLNATGLYARSPAGAWSKLADLSSATLAQQLGATPRDDLTFSNADTMLVGPDGTLYLAGENGTALARGPEGNLSMLPWPRIAPADLQVFVGTDPTASSYAGPAGQPIPIAGDASGGAAPYSFRWSVVSAPPGGAGVFQDASSPTTNFSAAVEGSYTLRLTVTDSVGSSVNRTVTMNVHVPVAGCKQRGGFILASDASAPTDAAGPGSHVLCVRLLDQSSELNPGTNAYSPTTQSIGFAIDVANDATNLSPMDLVFYLIDFSANGHEFQANVSASNFSTYTVNQPVMGGTLGLECSSSSGQFADEVDVNFSRGCLLPNLDATEDGQNVYTVNYVAVKKSPDNGSSFYEVQNFTASAGHPELGPGTFELGQPVAPPTTPVPSAPTPLRLDAHGLRLTWSPATDGNGNPASSYVVERSNDPNGASWAVVGTTGSTEFDDHGLQTYHPYLYRVTAVDGAGSPGSGSIQVSGAPFPPYPTFRASAWWNGTLWLSATDGGMYDLNASTGALERQALRYQDTGQNYTGDVNALLVAAAGLYAAGESGAIWLNDSRSWTLVQTPANATQTLRALVAHDGEIFAAGDGALVERTDLSGGFVQVPSPNCACDFSLGFETAATQELYFVTAGGQFATCDACTMSDPLWQLPEVPVPTYVSNGVPTVSRILDVASSATATDLSLSGGAVLDFASRSPFANKGDWQVRSDLAPHDGGFWGTKGRATSMQNPSSLRWMPSLAAQEAALGASDPYVGWSELRVTLHHVLNTNTASGSGEVRVYYAPYPQWYPSSSGSGGSSLAPTCNVKSDLAPANTESVSPPCNSTLLSDTFFLGNTSATGWAQSVLYVPPPSFPTGGTAPDPRFDSIEFLAEPGVEWAIDDFEVDARYPGSSAWTPLVDYFGPNDTLGQPQLPCYVSSSSVPALGNTADTAESTCASSVVNSNLWTEGVDSGGGNYVDNSSLTHDVFRPFDQEVQGAWHPTTALADRPVWALNDEELCGCSTPTLHDDWDTMLVSPTIDLSEAYDPVVSFRTAYAFRTEVDTSSSPAVIKPLDGGLVLVQYQMTGTECGAGVDPNATCWSRFYEVKPDRNGVAEYPRPNDLGYVGSAQSSQVSIQQTQLNSTLQDAYGNAFGLNETPTGWYWPDNGRSVSYWGRSSTMIPNEHGIITGSSDTSSYQTVVIKLSDPANRMYDLQGNPISLAGRQIKVGFESLTFQNSSDAWNNQNEAHQSGGTYAGEGWYITDFKVTGAQQLGIDLAATNMTFRVGYDVPRIGVGPGTRVPINVTIENHGQFDVAGFTGTLVVKRLVDAASRRTIPLGQVSLAQQPMLPSGASVNETFYWDVPTDEGAQYLLSFVATPVGAPDEDPINNVVTLGSYANPIVAQTAKEFHVELVVTPENATTDVVRYVPIFINNTGNVPLSGFDVTRTIAVANGQPDPSPTVQEWTTNRPVPAGTRMSLASLSDRFDPGNDLFWKAAKRSDYKFFVSASSPGLPTSTQDKLIQSFASYMFDDAELGPRGEATKGDWAFGPGWGGLQPGFRSDNSYGFGDNVLLRYPDNTDSSAVTPIIDLSEARSARLGLYTRFLFPDSFDGGVVEASTDGGKTWTRLVPDDYVDDNGTRWPGYGVQVAASSPLHLTHDPSQPTFVIGGDSSQLPGNSNGWVYREFDLTQLANITEPSIPYVLYDSAALGGYVGQGQHDDEHPDSQTTPNANYDPSWSTGPVDQYQYWESQNLTQDTIQSPTGAPVVWWSGSASLVDDGKRPLQNQFLTISLLSAWYETERNDDGSLRVDANHLPIVLDADGNRVYNYTNNQIVLNSDGSWQVNNSTGVPRVPALRADPKDTIKADWWEYADRTSQGMTMIGPSLATGIKEAALFQLDAQSDHAAPTIRLNLSQPEIVGQEGRWLHMEADLSSGYLGLVNSSAFVYAPISFDAPKGKNLYGSKSYLPYDDRRYDNAFVDDPGFAIDGFTIRAYKTLAGVRTDERVLLDASDAWNASVVQQCVDSTEPDYTQSNPGTNLPCWTAGTPNNPLQRGNVVPDATLVDVNGVPLPQKSSTTTLAPSSTSLADDAVDFLQSGVAIGDRLEILSGAGAGYVGAVTSVDQHELGLVQDLPPTQDFSNGSSSTYVVHPLAGDPGTTWSLVPQLPGIPSTWNVTSVRMYNGGANDSEVFPLPTGEIPKAWTTGGMCRQSNPADSFANNGTGDVKWTVLAFDGSTLTVPSTEDDLRVFANASDILLFTNADGSGGTQLFVRQVIDRHTLLVDRDYGDLNGTSFQVMNVPRSCLRPGADSRLVTPAIDLSRIAGSDATLSFWHQYGFYDLNPGIASLPIASGGVVELQVYDPQNGWGSWQQIFPCADTLYTPDSFDGSRSELGGLATYDQTLDGESNCGSGYDSRGGYSAFTVDSMKATTGPILRFDPPLQEVVHVKRDGSTENVHYLYSGNSSVVSGRFEDSWVNAHYDLAPWLGKTVRFGFHVETAGISRSNQIASASCIVDPEVTNPNYLSGQKTCANGWWIANVSVVGRVLEGAPVMLRLRAATDGSVDNGVWQVDDVGVFGSSYGRNVGVFANLTPGAYGALAGQNVTVPLVLRNLGDGVRRDLAVEVKQLDNEMPLLLSGDPNQTWTLDDTEDANHLVLRVSGFDLAPGYGVTIPVTVHVPASLSADEVSSTLHVTVKEFSAPDDTFVNVTDNEVQGFLTRDLTVVGQRAANVSFSALATSPVGPTVNGTLNATLVATNDGYGPVSLNLSCSAYFVLAWQNVDHNRVDEEKIAQQQNEPCALASGNETIAPLASSTLVFQSVPDMAGILHVVVNGTQTLGSTTVNVTPLSVSAMVGISPVIYHDGFAPGPKPATQAPDVPPPDADVKQNWTGGGMPDKEPGSPPTFLWPEGHDAQGAMLLGVGDKAFQQNGGQASDVCSNPAGRCTAISPPIDLRNFTNERIVLSFWSMPRFGKGDGGRVTAQVLVKESSPTSPGSWTNTFDECPLVPIGGYQGSLLEQAPPPQGQQGPQPDMNGYTQDPYSSTQTGIQTIGPGSYGFITGMSDSWQLTRIDLSNVTCPNSNDGTAPPIPLLGHTVRFNFETFVGQTGHTVGRTPSQGWFIDDVTVSPQSIGAAPASQEVTLLDNTTKALNVLLTNDGSFPDLVQLSLDPGNSSVPAGSLEFPPPVTLAPHSTTIVSVNVTLPRDPSFLPTQFRARLLARSLVDGNARGTTDFVLDFAPRPWAQLNVHADPPAGIVQEGTEAFIPITVENDGQADSVATTLSIVDQYVTSDGVAHADNASLDLPSLPTYFEKAEEAQRVLEFTWRPPRGSAGPHTLTITADPLQLGEEYTRTTNVVVLNVNVSDLLVPDLDVSSPDALVVKDASGAPVTAEHDADVTRYTVTAGDLATFDVTVSNTGKAGATNVDLRAFIGTLSLPPKLIPYVPPQSSVLVTFHWLAQKGEYPLEVDVRTDQVELSTANNRNPAKGVTLLTVKGYDVHATLSPPDLDIVPPLEVKVPFNVTNDGNAGEDLLFQTQAPDGWSVTLPRDALFLRAGETYSGTATVQVPRSAVAGEQFITLQAVARENPMKVASGTAPLKVHAFYGGSIETTQVSASPPGLSIPLQLSNQGNSLDPWIVTVRLPPGWTSQETLPARVVVPPHGSTLFTVHAVAPDDTPPGDRQMLVKATLPDGEKRDGVVTVTVDLLRTASLALAATTPQEVQGALSYPVTVENDGNSNGPFEAVLVGVPPGMQASLEPSTFTMPPGGRTIATLVVKPSPQLPAGAYPITAYTLFDGVNPTTAEGKANVHTLQLTLVRPDLRADPLDYAPRTGVRAGDHVVVRATIENRGQGVVTSLPVQLFVDDVFVDQAVIPALGSGETRTVALNWTAVPGQHTLTAVADPYNDTVQADRSTTAVAAAIQVGSAGLSGISGARVPGFELASSVIVLAAAAAVLARRARRPPG